MPTTGLNAEALVKLMRESAYSQRLADETQRIGNGRHIWAISRMPRIEKRIKSVSGKN